MSATERDPDEMSEEELAEYFYEHRDELAGEEVPSRTPARLDVMFSARFSREEADAVREAADEAKMTLSAFLRQAVLATTGRRVVDLERVRKDVAKLRELSDDAWQALA